MIALGYSRNVVGGCGMELLNTVSCTVGRNGAYILGLYVELVSLLKSMRIIDLPTCPLVHQRFHIHHALQQLYDNDVMMHMPIPDCLEVCSIFPSDRLVNA